MHITQQAVVVNVDVSNDLHVGTSNYGVQYVAPPGGIKRVAPRLGPYAPSTTSALPPRTQDVRVVDATLIARRTWCPVVVPRLLSTTTNRSRAASGVADILVVVNVAC